MTLVLPRDFRGPIHLVNCGRAKHTLSPAVQEAYTHISSEPPLSFIGSIEGWSGASPTEEDNAIATPSPFAPIAGWLGLSETPSASAATAAAAREDDLKGPRFDELWIDAEDRSSKISISFAGEAEDRACGTAGGRNAGRKAVGQTFEHHLNALCAIMFPCMIVEEDGYDDLLANLPRPRS